MKKVKLFAEDEILTCAFCGKNLMEHPEKGMMVIWEKVDGTHVKDVYTCCKGSCDKKLRTGKDQKGYIDGWKDLKDLMSPVLFLQNIMAMMNNMHNGRKFEEEAFNAYKHVILVTAQYVMRQPTEKEKDHAADMLSLQSF